MISPHLIEMVATEQHQDLLREIKKQRLIRQLPNHSPGWYRQVRYWLGSQMVNWGLKLQGNTSGTFIQASVEPGPVRKGLPN